MPNVARVRIHSSQFPTAVRRDLLASLATREVNHKFHYDSVKQTQKWLELHAAYSPSRASADCAAAYDLAFAAAASQAPAGAVHVVGLGCGGGQKDLRLLTALSQAGHEVFYTPCDVSTAMVLTARQTALAIVPDANCFPLVCDLATATDLPAALGDPASEKAARILTFFGMIPNFEPEIIVPKLASLVSAQDCLLFSANLAPGPDYLEGVRRILPQYDNALTRDWLMTFLLDLGVERDDGGLEFGIESGGVVGEFKRVVARFRFARPRKVRVEDHEYGFAAGDSIRLFYSYRYTPTGIRALLASRELAVKQEWFGAEGQEGVFLVRAT